MVICAVNTDSSLAFKLPEVGFEAIVRDDYTQLFLNESNVLETSRINGISQIETHYILGKIVEGYSLMDSIITKRLNYYIYENSSGKQYFYSQQLEVANIAVNTEVKVLEVIDTLYGKAQYYTNGSVSGLAWNYNNYSFKIEGCLSIEELESLQESLEKM